MPARFVFSSSSLAVAVIVVGCAAAPPPTSPVTETVTSRKRTVSAATPRPSPSRTPKRPGDDVVAPTEPEPGSTSAPANPNATPGASSTLVVDDAMGRVTKGNVPVGGIKVVGYPASGAGITAYRRTWRLMQAAPLVQTTTDPQGRFRFDPPASGALNIEAIESDTVKAFAFNVVPGTKGLELMLAATGTIKGKIKIPGVTALGGITVSIPGTPYQAVTDAEGNYTIPGVPWGSYPISASKDGLGTVNIPKVDLPPNATTNVSDAMITANLPVLTALSPTIGGRGTTVTITGSNFPDKDLKVEFGTLAAPTFTRVSATELQVKVPEGPAGEDVRVRLADVPSNALKFKVLSGLTLSNSSATLGIGETRTFSCTAVDPAGTAIASPTVTWAISSGDACTVDAATGLVTAVRAGNASLTARNGDLVSSALALTVTGTGTGGGGGSQARTYTTSTLAGGGDGASAVDGPIATARFTQPTGIAFNLNGPPSTFYVIDSTANTVRRVTASAVETVAGAAEAGTTDGVGPSARFDFPLRMSFNRYEAGVEAYTIADQRNHRIRRFVPSTGAITTIAGGGPGGLTGGSFLGGVGTNARFSAPGAAVMAPGGAIFVADTFNHCIRRIDPNSLEVTVFAGTAGEQGNTDGVGAAARFRFPGDLVVAANGNLYVADGGNSIVREITTAGLVSTVVGRDLDQPGANVNALFNSPYGLALDDSNRLYVADNALNRIFVVDLAANPRTVATLAGSVSNPAPGFADGTAPRFNEPSSLAVDSVGDLYIADTGNDRIRKITFNR